ncbi:uncharacterized protein LOC118324783 [Morone saxatilis]|uniref:uncharacterized protein LOC118324783 n=1 Tax=Morone saxatilis TaxID=34816 RepID=UPI0015E253F1|nr:uncharacterized protein LOC118324783 [Morone saxatilis]
MAGNCVCSLFGASLFIAGCTIILVTAFPIAQITIGAVYMYECPAAPVIPVYVMVCGILALLIMGLFALPNLCPAAPGHTIWTLWIISLVLFVFIWFFYGSYLIYSVYPPNYTKNTIDPNGFNNSLSTTTIYTPTAPDTMPGLTAPDTKPNLTLENQNQTLLNLNQTWITTDNQTLMKLVQTLALGNISSKANREHLKAVEAQRAVAAVPYCNRTVYMFAFWTTTLVYVFAGNTLVIIVCLYGFMAVTDKLVRLVTT